jgi:murein DD-endopeptidase MepM/ murein hydrolase activator NlpD
MITRRGALGGMAALAATRAAGHTAPPLYGEFTQGGWARGQTAPNAQITLDGTPIPHANGHYFLAFDRDAAPTATLVITRPNTAPETQILAIAPRAWHIEHVEAPFHPPAMPDEVFAKLRATEIAQINAARALDTGATGWQQAFQWPGKARLSGLFGSQRTYQGGIAGSYHSGTDIALAAGTIYTAPAAGTVILAADHPFTLEGNLLMLDHGMGLNSAFLHSSALLVQPGERVAQGQPIGRVGMTGRATGPHLHWSLRWREARLDPLLFTGPMA